MFYYKLVAGLGSGLETFNVLGTKGYFKCQKFKIKPWDYNNSSSANNSYYVTWKDENWD